MNRVARWNTVLEILAGTEDGHLTIEQAAQSLGVSAATVRRDFDELARQQMLTRTRGGVISNGLAYDLPLRYKTARHASEKQRIAQAAVQLLAPGQVIALNGGTTTTEVARALAARQESVRDPNLPTFTVVTNAVNIANDLTVWPHIKLVVLGGVARPQSYELIGPLATKLLSDISLDVAVLGVDAIDGAGGAYAHHEGEASINQFMAAKARQVVVVADGSKVGKSAFARIARVQDVDVLVTDSTAPASAVAQIEAAGCRVVLA